MATPTPILLTGPILELERDPATGITTFLIGSSVVPHRLHSTLHIQEYEAWEELQKNGTAVQIEMKEVNT